MTIRIAFGTIWYPVAMGRYFYEALKRRADVELWTYGPFTGRWIPWAGGMHTPPEYVYKPDLALALGDMRYGVVQPPWKPDIWIEVNAGLRTTGRPEGLYVIIASDPHVLDYSEARKKADLFFNMQTPYMQGNDIWLPYAYDPIWHTPTQVSIREREYHAALLGLQYPQRTALVSALRATGMNVRYELGPAYDDAKAIYHSSRVGLNWSSLQDTTARVYELMAFGICPVLNRVPDLMSMFKDGQDYLGFSNQDEAVMQVRSVVDDGEAIERMGAQARKAVEPHTYDARIERVLKRAGVLA
jgi:glycosyltransferase involved in cell wall biosynthesis